MLARLHTTSLSKVMKFEEVDKHLSWGSEQLVIVLVLVEVLNGALCGQIVTCVCLSGVADKLCEGMLNVLAQETLTYICDIHLVPLGHVPA